jgi:L-aminopeptidase/D-esterase-like protein
MHGDITDVPGILVGHDTNLNAGTGCTVVLCQWPAVGGVDVRGGAPGTRETDLLDPRCLVAEVHAVLLTGGSAFGLDAAGGVMRVLEGRGVGFDTGVARVPIVPAAVLFDLGLGRSDVRPDAAAGARATEAAAGGPVARGTVGAGTGATVGKMGGPALATKGGLGSASVPLPDGHVVGALVAVNASGDVYDPETGQILAGARSPTGVGWLVEDLASASGPTQVGDDPFHRRTPPAGPARTNTTIAVVATDLALNKPEAAKLAQMAHDGLARAIRPIHTPFDGDTVFALSLARPEARADSSAGAGPVALALAGALGAEALARAVADAVLAATGLHGTPAARELSWAAQQA